MTRFTWHGGGIEAAKIRFGATREPWVDLSTGINPRAWPGASAIPVDWRHLPDERGLAALEQAAAEHFGVDPAFVCALPGTEVGLRLAGLLLPRPAWHGIPTYRTHGEMFGNAIPLERGTWDRAEGGTLIFANPNNPDGHVIRKAELLRIMKGRGDGWLLIDEAFSDPDPTLSLADEVQADRRLLLFRSFGKFFGLAGLRLGFVIGPPAMLARFRERLGAWPVSAAAIAIGTQAYRDEDWIGETREWLHDHALALDIILRRAGHSAVGDCPLFRLIETDDAQALFERLARRAILTRPFDYQPRWLRLGLPADAAELTRLEEALRDG